MKNAVLFCTSGVVEVVMRELLAEIAADVEAGLGPGCAPVISTDPLTGGPLYLFHPPVNDSVSVRLSYGEGEVRLFCTEPDNSYSASFNNAPASMVVAAIVDVLL